MEITIGMKGEVSTMAEREDTAAMVGSGDLLVYATPCMAALMEGAACEAIAPALSEGTTSVGTALSIEHLSATPVGLEVRAEAEVIEEANFTANMIAKYKITFPVAYDCEGFRNASSRQYGMDKAVRTALAVKFLDTIAAKGYTPMCYASRNEMTDSRDWDMSILNKYKVWVAQYPTEPFPITPVSTYAGVQAMWQYTSKASLPGITGTVDMNVSYFDYDGIADPKDGSGAPQVAETAAANVQYIDVNEVVTPNTKVNLRVVPSTDSPDTIVVPINPGDMVFRMGIGNNGWSKVVLNGQTLYAYTTYLTKVM